MSDFSILLSSDCFPSPPGRRTLDCNSCLLSQVVSWKLWASIWCLHQICQSNSPRISPEWPGWGNGNWIRGRSSEKVRRREIWIGFAMERNHGQLPTRMHQHLHLRSHHWFLIWAESGGQDAGQFSIQAHSKYAKCLWWLHHPHYCSDTTFHPNTASPLPLSMFNIIYHQPVG